MLNGDRQKRPKMYQIIKQLKKCEIQDFAQCINKFNRKSVKEVNILNEIQLRLLYDRVQSTILIHKYEIFNNQDQQITELGVNSLPQQINSFEQFWNLILDTNQSNLRLKNNKFLQIRGKYNQKLTINLIQKTITTQQTIEIQPSIHHQNPWDCLVKEKKDEFSVYFKNNSKVITNTKKIKKLETNCFPNNCIGVLTMRYGKAIWTSTAFLVTPVLIITAAHIVQLHKSEKSDIIRAQQIDFDLNGVNRRVIQWRMKYSQDCWKYDYALALLEQPILLDNYIGLIQNYEEMTVAEVGNFAPKYQIGMIHNQSNDRSGVVRIYDGMVYHTIGTTKQQNGSPIFVSLTKDISYFAIGVQTFAKGYSSGTIFTKSSIDNIRAWEKQLTDQHLIKIINFTDIRLPFPQNIPNDSISMLKECGIAQQQLRQLATAKIDYQHRAKRIMQLHKKMGYHYFHADKPYFSLKNMTSLLLYVRNTFGQKHIDTAFAYQKVGYTYGYLQERDLEMEYNNKSLQILNQIPESKQSIGVRAHIYSGMAIRCSEGDTDKRLDYLQQALQLYTQINDKHQIQITKRAISLFSFIKSGDEDCEALIQKCNSIINFYVEDRGQNHESVAIHHLHLFDKYSHTKQWKQAIEHIGIAFSIFKNIHQSQCQYVQQYKLQFNANCDSCILENAVRFVSQFIPESAMLPQMKRRLAKMQQKEVK